MTTDNRNIEVITDADGKKTVLINDIVFKGKRSVNWNEVKLYLKQFVGKFYEIENSSEIVFIGSKLPDEYTGSESTKILMGANAKAKANAAKEKHHKDAKYGWYRYDIRFALPVYEGDVVTRHNVFEARLLINHAENGNKYLYDILAIKKETSRPQQ